jgi:ent-kaurene oxidase
VSTIISLAHQDRLYQEIQQVCGDDKVTEDHLRQLPYLNAVFHETLRYHSPVPLIPPRFVHENTKLAGYDVPAGTEVTEHSNDMELHECNMNFWLNKLLNLLDDHQPVRVQHEQE